MAYLSCTLQLYLNRDCEVSENICICIFGRLDILYLGAFLHTLSEKQQKSLYTIYDFINLMHDYNQHVQLVATC